MYSEMLLLRPSLCLEENGLNCELILILGLGYYTEDIKHKFGSVRTTV